MNKIILAFTALSFGFALVAFISGLITSISIISDIEEEQMKEFEKEKDEKQ